MPPRKTAIPKPPSARTRAPAKKKATSTAAANGPPGSGLLLNTPVTFTPVVTAGGKGTTTATAGAGVGRGRKRSAAAVAAANSEIENEIRVVPRGGGRGGAAAGRAVKKTRLETIPEVVEEEEDEGGSFQLLTQKFDEERAKQAAKSAAHVAAFQAQVTDLETEALENLAAQHNDLVATQNRNMRRLDTVRERIGGMEQLEREWESRRMAMDEVLEILSGLKGGLKSVVTDDEVLMEELEKDVESDVEDVRKGIEDLYNGKMLEMESVLKKGEKDTARMERKMGSLLKGVHDLDDEESEVCI